MLGLEEIKKVNRKAEIDYRKKQRSLSPPLLVTPKWDAKTKLARFDFLARWMIALFDGQRSPIPKHKLRGLIELLRIEVEK